MVFDLLKLLDQVMLFLLQLLIKSVLPSLPGAKLDWLKVLQILF